MRAFYAVSKERLSLWQGLGDSVPNGVRSSAPA